MAERPTELESKVIELLEELTAIRSKFTSRWIRDKNYSSTKHPFETSNLPVVLLEILIERGLITRDEFHRKMIDCVKADIEAYQEALHR